MKHTLELLREYISISNSGKTITNMTNYELRVMRRETPDFTEFFAVEGELQKRGALKQTMRQAFQEMTGGKIVVDK